MALFDNVGSSISKVNTTVGTINHYEKKISGLINDPLGTLLSNAGFGSFSTGELGKLISRPDALMSFNWEVNLPTLTLNKSYSLGSEYVESCSLVLPEIGIRHVRLNGVFKSYPEATINYNTVSMQIYADVENTAFSYFRAWMSLVTPTTGGLFGTPKQSKQAGGLSGYKNDIDLIAKDAYGDQLFIVKYCGAWPTSITSTEDFNSSNGRISFIVTFAIDDVITSGYNIDTITNTIKSSITGTIKSLANSVVDTVVSSGKSIVGSITTPISNAISNAINVSDNTNQQ